MLGETPKSLSELKPLLRINVNELACIAPLIHTKMFICAVVFEILALFHLLLCHLFISAKLTVAGSYSACSAAKSGSAVEQRLRGIHIVFHSKIQFLLFTSQSREITKLKKKLN
jgi:hypothetical protein